jgi:RimK family alpha-L-glutamate ligase
MTRNKSDKTVIVASESQGLYTTKRLLIEAKKLKCKSLWLSPYDCLINLQNSGALNGLYFHRTTGVRYDDFDLVTALFYQDAGMKVSNSLESLKTFRNKDEQALFFKRHELNSIPTLFYRGHTRPTIFDELKALSKNGKYILKMSRGNQGVGVNLVESFQSLKCLLETFEAMKDQRFIIQPFIEHKKQWRIFIIKNEIHAVIERTLTKDDFRGNSKRATGKLLKKIPADLRDLAVNASISSGLDYCGIDILEDKNTLRLLEVNAVPGFLEAEELSGINIARELITKLY